MNERITHYCENYMLRTISAAYGSSDEEATGLAGELPESDRRRAWVGASDSEYHHLAPDRLRSGWGRS